MVEFLVRVSEEEYLRFEQAKMDHLSQMASPQSKYFRKMVGCLIILFVLQMAMYIAHRLSSQCFGVLQKWTICWPLLLLW